MPDVRPLPKLGCADAAALGYCRSRVLTLQNTGALQCWRPGISKICTWSLGGSGGGTGQALSVVSCTTTMSRKHTARRQGQQSYRRLVVCPSRCCVHSITVSTLTKVGYVLGEPIWYLSIHTKRLMSRNSRGR